MSRHGDLCVFWHNFRLLGLVQALKGVLRAPRASTTGASQTARTVARATEYSRYFQLVRDGPLEWRSRRSMVSAPSALASASR